MMSLGANLKSYDNLLQSPTRNMMRNLQNTLIQ